MAEASWGKFFVVKGEAEWQNVSGCLSSDEVSVCDEAMQTENRHREATFHVTQSSLHHSNLSTLLASLRRKHQCSCPRELVVRDKHHSQLVVFGPS